MRTLLALLALCIGPFAHAAAPAPAEPPPGRIVPGAVWLDNRGLPIHAHGGGVLQHEGMFYWFGEDRSPDLPKGWRAASCYASKDLIHWEHRNRVFASADPELLGGRWVFERPKVFFNRKTGKFVMYAHLDATPNRDGVGSAYALARVAVLTSDTVDGNYTYVRSFRPLGLESRDIGAFVDDDGSAYLIFESRPTKGFYIAALSDDYLDVVKSVCFIQNRLEGGSLVKIDGLYYIIGSWMTGWDPNPNQYATATKIEGPWSKFHDIAPPETKTYSSQSTFLLKVTGTKATSVIYMGDMWNKAKLPDSRYLWMPLEIGGGKLRLPKPQPWTIDVKTGITTLLPPDEAK